MCLQPGPGGYDSYRVCGVEGGRRKDLEQALATIGPIAGAIDAAHLGFLLYKSGFSTNQPARLFPISGLLLSVTVRIPQAEIITSLRMSMEPCEDGRVHFDVARQE